MRSSEEKRDGSVGKEVEGGGGVSLCSMIVKEIVWE
jgi:hypothetical protein